MVPRLNIGHMHVTKLSQKRHAHFANHKLDRVYHLSSACMENTLLEVRSFYERFASSTLPFLSPLPENILSVEAH